MANVSKLLAFLSIFAAVLLTVQAAPGTTKDCKGPCVSNDKQCPQDTAEFPGDHPHHLCPGKSQKCCEGSGMDGGSGGPEEECKKKRGRCTDVDTCREKNREIDQTVCPTRFHVCCVPRMHNFQ